MGNYPFMIDNKKASNLLKLLAFKWWAQQDSNLRPTDYE